MSSSDGVSFNASEYWRTQDFGTSARLHLQHWIWQYQLGYALHPKIDASQKSLKIADVACGNGAWLLEVYRNAPQHEYHGFDLTPVHFPAAQWLPSNMKLDVWDAFSAVPSDYVGAFDVVHIRTFYSIIKDNAVEPILKNLLAMLKPEGYIQWDETDASVFKVETPDGVDAPAMSAITNTQDFLSKHQTKLLPDWLHNLPQTLQGEGCEVLAHEKIPARRELSRAWTDNLLIVWTGLIPMLPDQPIPLPEIPGLLKALSKQSFAEKLAEAVSESTKGAWVSQEQVVVVARKQG